MDQLAFQKGPRNVPTILPVAIVFVEQLHVLGPVVPMLCSAGSLLHFDIFGKEAIRHHQTKEGQKALRDPRLDRL